MKKAARPRDSISVDIDQTQTQRVDLLGQPLREQYGPGKLGASVAPDRATRSSRAAAAGETVATASMTTGQSAVRGAFNSYMAHRPFLGVATLREPTDIVRHSRRQHLAISTENGPVQVTVIAST